MPNIDPMQVARLVEEVTAEELLPRFRKLTAGEISQKAPGQFVTIADHAMEAALSRRLKDLSPNSVVVGEEAAAADPQTLERLTEDAPTWIVDPLDGTAYFARGERRFGVIVALAHRGETLAGWIYDPLGARFAWTMRGEGAWMGDVRLRVADPTKTPLRGRLSPRPLQKRLLGANVEQRFDLLPSIWCASHEHLDLATGTTAFAAFRNANSWDHAAGVLMHREAGGHSARFDGAPYDIARSEGGLLLAPDEASWRELANLILDRS